MGRRIRVMLEIFVLILSLFLVSCVYYLGFLVYRGLNFVKNLVSEDSIVMLVF